MDEKHLIYGRTALHEAVAMNNIPMAKILLKAGANPNVANDKAVRHSPDAPLLRCLWRIAALPEAGLSEPTAFRLW